MDWLVLIDDADVLIGASDCILGNNSQGSITAGSDGRVISGRGEADHAFERAQSNEGDGAFWPSEVAAPNADM